MSAFQPISGANNFSYELGKADSKQQADLTLQWGKHKVKLKCSTEKPEAMTPVQQFHQRTFSLDGKTFVHVNSLDPSVSEAAKQAMDYIILEQELDGWANKAADTHGKQNRIRAANLIRECIDNGGESLDLKGLGLTSLPEHFGNLHQLKELDLSNNTLGELPRSAENLKKLEVLNLENNAMLEFPPVIGGMKALRVLSLAQNILTSLGSISRYSDQFRNLEVLNLGKNAIENFSLNLSDFAKLQELYLNNNRLTALPEDIGYLKKNLAILNISHNPIKSLPDSIFKLQLDNPFLDLTGHKIPKEDLDEVKDRALSRFQLRFK